MLFIYSAFFRGDVRHLSWKNLGKAAGFFGAALGIYMLIGYLGVPQMIDLFTSLMFVVSIFSYLFISALFSMYFCFEQGVKLDDQIYKAPTFVSFFTRWGLFFLCILVSIFLVLYGPSFISHEAPL